MLYLGEDGKYIYNARWKLLSKAETLYDQRNAQVSSLFMGMVSAPGRWHHT
jgi:hypothetical protein